MNHGWYDEMWNPMTGADRSEIRSAIRNHCNRFSGDVRLNLSFANSYEEVEPGYYVLNKPVKSQNSDTKVKHDHKGFLHEQAIHNIY